MAGLLNARAQNIGGDEHAVLDATAHSLKFAGFQDMYFNDAFPPEYGVTPDKSLANRPELLLPESARQGRTWPNSPAWAPRPWWNGWV